MTRAEAFVIGLITGVMLATISLATFRIPGVVLP
jgi:hypothetical protein